MLRRKIGWGPLKRRASLSVRASSKESKMHLHLRHSRGVDAKGRVHISTDEMAEIYRNFHQALNETYWETASNHKICTDAMETLKTTHISKKNGRFLVLFTSVLSEAYSHAHYNVQELLYDDRDQIRGNYWTDVLSFHKAVMAKADKVHAHSKCLHQLALLLHFASLYSLYKDVANEEFIISLYQRAENYILNDHHRLTDAEADQIKEYHDAIQTIYHLRGERSRPKVGNATEKLEEAPTLALNEIDVVDATRPDPVQDQEVPLSKDELYAIYDKALERHKKMVMKRQQTMEELEKTVTAEISPVSSECSVEEEKFAETQQGSRKISSQNSTDQNRCAVAKSVVVTSEKELEQVIKKLNPVVLSEKVETVKEKEPRTIGNSSKQRQSVSSSKHCPERRNTLATVPTLREFAGKNAIVLDKYDFKGEFERRCGRKKFIPPTALNLPIIGRPNKDDTIQSYRRKGLFDDVGFRQPPNLHKMQSFTECSSSTNTHAMVTYEEEEDLSREAEDDDIQNNNSLTPNSYMTEKIIKAVLAEKPVSPISPHRRMSMTS